MSSVLQFSPAFKPSLSLADLPSAPHKSSKKRKRGLEPLDGDGVNGGVEGSEAESYAKGTSLPSRYSNAFITTSSTGLIVAISRGDNTLHSQDSSHTDHGGSHTKNFPQPFPHHIAETAPLVSKGRISDELATLKPPLYVSTGRVPTTTAEESPSGTSLRQHHLRTITAILHRCLSEGDYIRAGRAWAMLLRAEQSGYSMDLRTHDRWGVGAEVLMQRESQIVQKTLAHKIVEIPSSTSNFRVKAESMEKAKEYYERVVLQYPYRKASPNATGPLNFSMAMFSLWICAVKEQSLTALMAVGSSDKKIDETNAETNDEVQRSSARDMEPDRYRKREQIRRGTLQSAHEIASRVDRLLVSPPYSDSARFRRLCGEMSLWIADLSVATIFSSYSPSISGDDEDLTMGSPSLLRNVSRSTSSNKKHKARQE
ncbi:MAG: hypothetical protein Q9175_005269 [Cornicularia normoerica]